MGILRKLFGSRHSQDVAVVPQVRKAMPSLDSKQAAVLAKFEKGDENSRMEAAIELSRCPGEPSVTALTRGLKDTSPRIRGCCAESLRLLRAPNTVGALTDVLLNDSEHDPAYYAAKALGALGTQAVNGLISALEQRKGDISEVAFQLGELRAPGAVNELLRVLGDKDSGKVSAYARRHIVMALQKIGDRRAVPSLKLALCDEDSGVRERAQRALSVFGEHSSPFLHTNGCILHYRTRDEADRDFDLVLDLLKNTQGFSYDVGVLEAEDAYALLVTSNRPEIRQAFREILLPKLNGDDLEFSNEQKLPALLGGTGRLARHQHVQ